MIICQRSNTTNENLNLLGDLELILGLHAILFYLDNVHTLINSTQSHDVLVCDFINVVNSGQLQFYRLYNDPYNKFNDFNFDEVNVLETFTNKNLSMN
jgi:hypothetical protein